MLNGRINERNAMKMRARIKRCLPIIFSLFATVFLVSFLNSLSDYRPEEGDDKNPTDNYIKYGKPVQLEPDPGLHPHREGGYRSIKATRNIDRTGSVVGKEREETVERNSSRPSEQDNETRWRKDDEVLVPIEPIDADLPPRKEKLDPDIVALKEVWKLDTYPEPDEACPNKTTLEEFYWKKHRKTWPKDDSWDIFFAQIGNCDLYRETSEIVENLLEDMATMPVKSVSNLEGGTQVKLYITFQNGKGAVFKPMRFGRNYETDPNHFYFTDFERHHAEIAAFHIDRLLGLRRAIPTVGRVFNISSDLRANADDTINTRFFFSPVKNLCFVGKCDYYCDTTHAICGNPDLKEGSLQVWLPDDDIAQRDYWRSPYKRTYSKRNQLAPWQLDSSFCTSTVKNYKPFTTGRRLLDIVDLYIFDFITGNQDRHHYESFTFFDPVPHLSYIVHLDNGRSFGHPHFDDLDILAPLIQCCHVRPSTVKTLLKYYLGPTSFAQALKASMSRDPVHPILARKYLIAVDRRVEIVLKEVARCVHKADGNVKKVLINHFHNPDAPPNPKEFEDSGSEE